MQRCWRRYNDTVDITPNFCVTEIPTVISEGQALNWFVNNDMKINPTKYHHLVSTKSLEVVSDDGIQVLSSTVETLLGIAVD